MMLLCVLVFYAYIAWIVYYLQVLFLFVYNVIAFCSVVIVCN